MEKSQMPTITADRVRIQRSINWEAYREHRAHLADIFPAISSVAGCVTPEEASYASMELKAHYVMRKLLRRDAVRSFARAA
jgi:hypothetical protein